MVAQIGICHRALFQDAALKRRVTGMAEGLRKAGSRHHYTLCALEAHMQRRVEANQHGSFARRRQLTDSCQS
jgi:hypothetical protein